MGNNKIRCHFSIVFENVFATIWFIIIIALSEIIGEINNLRKGYVLGSDLYFLLILVGIISIAALIHFFIWRKTFISIEGKSLVIDKDTIFQKKKRTIALSSVSNVNLEQNLFERIIGTYKIKLDTNSMSTAEGTDVKIVLKKKEADIFKGELLSIIQNSSGEIKEENEDLYDIKYNFNEIVKHSIYSTPISVGVYGIAVISAIIMDSYNGKVEKLGEGIIGMILGLAIIIIPIIYSLIKNMFKFYDFKVGRREDEIHISYGLLTKRKYTIPVEKINAVIIDEPTISRIFKRKNIQLVNIGMGDDSSEGAQLLLSEKYNDYKEKLNSLLPEFIIEEKLERQSKKCIYNYICYLLINLIISIGFSIMFTPFFMIYMIFPIIYFVLKYKTWGLEVNEKYIAFANGIFKKKTKYVSYDKIQSISIHQGPISKKLNTARMNVYILSSIINRISFSGFYDMAKLEEINDRL